MAILFCGGEEIDFTPHPIISSTTSNRRSLYSRCSLYGASGYVSHNFIEQTSLWASSQQFWSTGTTAPTNSNLFGLVDASGRGYLLAKLLGKFSLLSTDGSTFTTVAQETGTSCNVAGVHKVDLQIETYGAVGAIRGYLNGILLIEHTGDIRLTDLTGFTNFKFWSNVSNSYNAVSEMIAATEDTRLFSLKTLAPNAAGDDSEWIGAYTDIDEEALSDADTVYTDTVGKVFSANLTGMPTGNFITKAVKVAYRAADGVGGIGIKGGIKTNSAYHYGSNRTLISAWENLSEYYQENPATSNRFTPAEIDALQIAFESITP